MKLQLMGATSLPRGPAHLFWSDPNVAPGLPQKLVLGRATVRGFVLQRLFFGRMHSIPHHPAWCLPAGQPLLIPQEDSWQPCQRFLDPMMRPCPGRLSVRLEAPRVLRSPGKGCGCPRYHPRCNDPDVLAKCLSVSWLPIRLPENWKQPREQSDKFLEAWPSRRFPKVSGPWCSKGQILWRGGVCCSFG